MAEQQTQQQQLPPEVREQFNMFVTNGLNIIHEEQVTNDILNRILKSGDPIQAIAEATVDIVTRLYDSAKKNGVEIYRDVLIHGANVLMGEIINMAEAAGMQKLSDEQKTQAFQIATSMFIDQSVKTGRISKEELAGMGKEVVQNQPEMQKASEPASTQGPPMAGGV